MGLDGISVNQLRMGSELNSNELNNINPQTSPQFINGLSKGQRIDADDKNNQNHAQGEILEQEDENEDDKNDENDGINKKTPAKDITKYDLSDTKKYALEIDDKTNTVSIKEKSSQTVIQTFDIQTLSNLTKYLKNYCGVLINRKYKNEPIC